MLSKNILISILKKKNRNIKYVFLSFFKGKIILLVQIYNKSINSRYKLLKTIKD